MSINRRSLFAAPAAFLIPPAAPAAAEPVIVDERRALLEYLTWLTGEKGAVRSRLAELGERHNAPLGVTVCPAFWFHQRPGSNPSHRARAVMAAAGCEFSASAADQRQG